MQVALFVERIPLFWNKKEREAIASLLMCLASPSRDFYWCRV